ncbi:unnamed protein product [Cuscuta campestris]|uniref:Uncharacterized protein n=1 Tax=Cuscuta campestris TaxID=132261 RepID=A0A484LMV7_9ASTE|nr:unnamed protein product [Cuscuta campestris]
MPRCKNASSRQESAAEEGERPWRREGSKYIHIQTGLAFNTGALAERFHNIFLTKEIVSPKIVNKDLFKSATYAPSKSLFSQQGLFRFIHLTFEFFCPNLIRQFYANLRTTKGDSPSLISYVVGKTVFIDGAGLTSLFGLRRGEITENLDETFQDEAIWRQLGPAYPTATRADVHLVGSGPIERFEMWGRHRSLTESVYLSSAVLADYGYAEEMEQLLQGTRWHRLFTMRAESSLPLTIEFLCSLELEPSTGSRLMNLQSIDSHTTLTFTLLGQGFQLTEANVAVFEARFLYNQSMGNRTHIVCGFVVTILFRWLVGSTPIPHPQMLMRDLDTGMLRNAHIRRRLGASSTESNAASSSAPSTSGASSHVSSRRATRRRPTTSETPAATT